MLLAVFAMNAIYIGVALPGPVDVLVGETAVACAVCMVAWVLHERRSRWLVACVGVHAGIDLGHFVVDGAPVPDWYIWGCLGYDVAFALGAAMLLPRPGPRSPSPGGSEHYSASS